MDRLRESDITRFLECHPDNVDEQIQVMRMAIEKYKSKLSYALGIVDVLSDSIENATKQLAKLELYRRAKATAEAMAKIESEVEDDL